MIIVLVSFIFSIILGKLFINYFNKKDVKQTVREDGLKSHYKKTGTPTMGGFIFIIPIIISIIYLMITNSKNIGIISIIFYTFIAYFVIGFIDDYKKVIKKHNDGLSAKAKLILQIACSIPIVLYLIYFEKDYFVFFNSSINSILLKILISIFYIFVIVAVTNASNLTDGSDGLLSSVTIVIMLFFTYIYYKYNREFIILPLSVIASLFGFLIFNKNPAKVMMGDTGSISLGALIFIMAIHTKTVLLIPIVCIIFFVEAISVMIQVYYYKKTGGKRIFLMAPIHHHLELKGYSENKTLLLFSFITLIGVIIGGYIRVRFY